MTEELIINKFLERNYEVTIEKDDFCYLDIDSANKIYDLEKIIIKKISKISVYTQN
jgi:hypothetical protein